MTIVRNLPSQLILAHAPWLLGGGLIVAMIGFAAAGVALIFAGEWRGLPTVIFGAGIPMTIFALTVQKDQAIFDADNAQITLQRQTLLGYSRKVLPLDSLRGAELDEIAETARPVILIDTGERIEQIPLVHARNSGRGPRHAVTAINDWNKARQRVS